jgi:peptide/nickel transport system permease protein
MVRLAIALLFLALWTLGALLAPLLAPYPFAEIDLPARLDGSSAAHWLGTDDLGRDVLSRLLYGGRVSLAVVSLSLALALSAGLLAGTFSGYLGGAADALLGRVMDVLLAMPGILLAIAILAYVGRGFAPLVLALSATAWVGYARVARSMALSLKERDFVLSTRALGARAPRTVLRHLVPHTTGVLAVQAAAGAAGVLLAEAGLSFLGLGIQPPHPSWGEMLSTGCDYLMEAPHLAVAPGCLLFLAVWSLNTLGEALSERLDPARRSLVAHL